MSFEYYNAYELVAFNDKPFWREFYSKFINSVYLKWRFWNDDWSELDTPFPIKGFVSISRELIFFDVILPLFYKIEINFGWNVTL